MNAHTLFAEVSRKEMERYAQISAEGEIGEAPKINEEQYNNAIADSDSDEYSPVHRKKARTLSLAPGFDKPFLTLEDVQGELLPEIVDSSGEVIINHDGMVEVPDHFEVIEDVE